VLKAETAIELREKCDEFSFDDKMKHTIAEINAKGIHIPTQLIEKKTFQSLLVFNEQNFLIEQIQQYNLANQNTPAGSATNQLIVRGTTIDYANYQSLAEKVLEGLNISRLKLQHSKTITVQENANNEKRKPWKNKTRNVRFNTKNEKQIGFIAELICYQKLIDKHGEENVVWISENAFRAYPQKFITGEAGKGYDLELKESGKVRFIEIKGSSNISGGI